MNFKKTMTNVGMKAKKASPHIMFVMALVGLGYSFVSACIKARKLDDVLEEEIEAVEEAKEILETAEKNEASTPEDIKEAKRLVRKARRSLIAKGVKVFIVPAAVGFAAIILLCGSHYILTNRLGIVSATLAALQDEYREYRAGVKEKYGEEVDHSLRFKETEQETTSVNEETGEEETSVMKVTDWRKGHSIYALAFCKTMCGNMFNNDQYMDMLTIRNGIKSIQAEYEDTGIAWWRHMAEFIHHDVPVECVRAGWSSKNPNGDGFVDIKIIPAVFEFQDGVYEDGYILDPNVDGDIETYIGSPRMKGLRKI